MIGAKLSERKPVYNLKRPFNLMKYPFQDSLPKQPLPSLDKTCEGYLQIVAPLLNETDLARTIEQVTELCLESLKGV